MLYIQKMPSRLARSLNHMCMSDVILVSDILYVCRVLCYIYVLYMCRMIDVIYISVRSYIHVSRI